MRLLLDSCSFIWIINDSDRLSQNAREMFMDGDNEIYLSTISIWEMTIKFQLGKIPFSYHPGKLIPMQMQFHDIELLPLSTSEIYNLTNLDYIHRDPFDRLLASQAMLHDMTILTCDKYLQQYPIKTVW